MLVLAAAKRRLGANAADSGSAVAGAAPASEPSVPEGLPANSQLLRSMAIRRIWFSIQLLSTSNCPSSTKRVSAIQRLRP